MTVVNIFSSKGPYISDCERSFCSIEMCDQSKLQDLHHKEYHPYSNISKLFTQKKVD
jgi:hypothetical protein